MAPLLGAGERVKSWAGGTRGGGSGPGDEECRPGLPALLCALLIRVNEGF